METDLEYDSGNTMRENEVVTSETRLSEPESRALIARLSDPSLSLLDGRSRVKDLAETLEMDVDQVIAHLEVIRDNRNQRQVPEEADKIVTALFQLQTKCKRKVTNKPLKRMIVITVLLLLVLFLAPVFIAQRSTQMGYANKMRPDDR